MWSKKSMAKLVINKNTGKKIQENTENSGTLRPLTQSYDNTITNYIIT